ncbi:MCT family MFS transporter [Aspergillus saccharolyticus JOP 1030-1]|uniref:Monocarboxylate transporter n=1 Tax=Aspergillus saccharolyticus JOP 1030-1 TaxID=1450539 RepID=A0A318Z6S8_9EURO|nr:monocarboxylate transporter [Aspergillus saccharolyticus JOP 1030-1]PYH43011.1 monocarboxylate transporter [Aspergillus saccharolyticus JOP 1030-1]
MRPSDAPPKACESWCGNQVSKNLPELGIHSARIGCGFTRLAELPGHGHLDRMADSKGEVTLSTGTVADHISDSAPKEPPPQTPKNEGTPEPTHPKWHYIAIVAAACLIMMTTCSFVFAFGVYQSLYEEMAAQPNTPFTGTSTALIDLIGTLAIALMSMAGPYATSWSKHFSPQAVIIAGGWVFGVAYILASFSKTLWQFALTQGLLLGVGCCLAYVPTMSVAPTWFSARRGLAMGVIISGTGIGGMMWPPVLRAMISHIGFRNALRVSGCVATTIVSAAGALLRWEPRFHEKLKQQQQQSPPTGKKYLRLLFIPLIDRRTALSARFLAQAAGCFLQSAAYSTPLFFYVSFAQTLGYSASTAATFLTISNASNFLSRIVLGYLADKLGRINALAVTTLLSALSVFAFWFPATFAADKGVSTPAARGCFIVFTVLYGSFASAYISLFPASLVEVFGVERFTSVNGVLYLIRGMGALIGTPLVGMLIPERTALVLPQTYRRAAGVVGGLLLAAAGACFWVRWEMRNGRWRV